MASSQQPDLICFCAQDWWYHNHAHSDFQLMTRAARHRKVLLVNSLGMRVPMPGRSTLPFRRIFRKVKSTMRHLRKPVPDLPDYNVLSPLLLPFYGSARMRRLNARLVRRQVESAAAKLGIEKPHIFVTIPTAYDVAIDMERSSMVYNRSDKHSAFTEADTTVISDLENNLLRDSDLVLYSSRAFMGTERRQVGDRGRFLDHGVDLEAFGSARRDASPSARLAEIKRPIIGFFGGFDDYVIDFDLLEKVAKELPDASLVLIGATTVSMDRIARYPNVHYLGYKPYAEIPSYGVQFDVGIMPWLDNDWIANCNPIKLKEYLALGLEVVSTSFPELDYYTDHIHVATNHDQFVARVQAVLQGKQIGHRPERAALLNASTWDARTVELLAELDGILETPRPEQVAPCVG